MIDTQRKIKKLWPSQRHPAKLVTVANGTVVAVDSLIAPAIHKLSRLGVFTLYSCQGDQRAREAPDHLVSLGYICLAKRHDFPTSLIEIVDSTPLSLAARGQLYSCNRNSLTPNEVRAANRRFVQVLQTWAKIK